MRCNRKTAYFTVTPHRKMIDSLDITEIWQLRRRENPKPESLKLRIENLQVADNQFIAL